MSSERVLLSLLFAPEGREKLRSIASALEHGSVLIYPTETIYGIGGLYGIPGVKERIVSAKGRAAENPMILVAANRSHLQKLAVSFPDPAEKLADLFWPGMLTLVLPSPEDPRGVSVRISPHPFIQSLFSYIDSPIYSTSANLSGVPYANDPDTIFKEFSQKVDFMVDAGPLPLSLASTVVRVDEQNTVRILREGAIPAALIFDALETNRASGSFTNNPAS